MNNVLLAILIVIYVAIAIFFIVGAIICARKCVLLDRQVHTVPIDVASKQKKE